MLDKSLIFKAGYDKAFLFNEKNKTDGFVLLNAIADAVITACFFDPQYRGVLDKLNYGNEGDRQKGRYKLIQMSSDLIASFIKQISRVLIKRGHLFLWVDKFHLCEGINAWLDGTNLCIVDLITWDKGRIGMGYRTRKQVEYLLILQKKPLRAKGIWQRHDIADICFEKVENKTHTHQKPLKLQKDLIDAVSKEGDIILDPCAGSYGVQRASLSLGRHFLGSDIE